MCGVDNPDESKRVSELPQTSGAVVAFWTIIDTTKRVPLQDIKSEVLNARMGGRIPYNPISALWPPPASRVSLSPEKKVSRAYRNSLFQSHSPEKQVKPEPCLGKRTSNYAGFVDTGAPAAKLTAQELAVKTSLPPDIELHVERIKKEYPDSDLRYMRPFGQQPYWRCVDCPGSHIPAVPGPRSKGQTLQDHVLSAQHQGAVTRRLVLSGNINDPYGSGATKTTSSSQGSSAKILGSPAEVKSLVPANAVEFGKTWNPSPSPSSIKAGVANIVETTHHTGPARDQYPSVISNDFNFEYDPVSNTLQSIDCDTPAQINNPTVISNDFNFEYDPVSNSLQSINYDTPAQGNNPSVIKNSLNLGLNLGQDSGSQQAKHSSYSSPYGKQTELSKARQKPTLPKGLWRNDIFDDVLQDFKNEYPQASLMPIKDGRGKTGPLIYCKDCGFATKTDTFATALSVRAFEQNLGALEDHLRSQKHLDKYNKSRRRTG